jgi:transcriptional regulator with XRE-family HTH domain
MPSLRNIRRRHLLSQRDLARKSGVTASTIYLIENGRTEPRLSVMRRICDALDVPPTEIDEFARALAMDEAPEPAPMRRAA